MEDESRESICFRERSGGTWVDSGRVGDVAQVAYDGV